MLVWRTHRPDTAPPGSALEIKTLSSYAAGQSPGIPGRHPGWAEVSAGHQPIRPSAGQGLGGGASLGTGGLGRLQRGKPQPERWSWEEARQIAGVLDQGSQTYVDGEMKFLVSQGQRICYDGDLTGLPVSNTSRTYPNAAFSHMDAEIRLGYQAALVSLQSPTYGRLWLSIAHHPGDTVSCTQAEALVLAAEARTGLRPRRRTELLRDRFQAFEQQRTQTSLRLETQKRLVQRTWDRLAEAEAQKQDRQRKLDELANQYRRKTARSVPPAAWRRPASVFKRP